MIKLIKYKILKTLAYCVLRYKNKDMHPEHCKALAHNIAWYKTYNNE